MHLGGISGMLWKGMAFMLTHFPSASTESPMCQAVVPGIGHPQHSSLHDERIFSAKD